MLGSDSVVYEKLEKYQTNVTPIQIPDMDVAYYVYDK